MRKKTRNHGKNASFLIIVAALSILAIYRLLTFHSKENKHTYHSRIAFMIGITNSKDAVPLESLLKTLYHNDNYFFIHLDGKASLPDKMIIQNLLSKIKAEVNNYNENIILIENPVVVSWGKYSLLLAAFHSMSTALAHSNSWEYWINLSPADMPLLSPLELQEALGVFSKANQSSFIGGNYPDWKALNLDRRTTYLDDLGLYLYPDQTILKDFQKTNNMNKVRTHTPDLFNVFKGEFWVVLHRSLAEYIHHSRDNVALSLQIYFSSTYISDELFFQTLVCHPKFPKHFNIINHSMRFIRWKPMSHGHPAVIDSSLYKEATSSGEFFARKFDHLKEPRSVSQLIKSFNDASKSEGRVKRSIKRASEVGLFNCDTSTVHGLY
mmetsp:Transcript_2589/g.3850  ORF Transcript_2589/g.3850 Transcript_2589/m.3850 type:complete len:381 (-) Transcript_2589:40-1182(-)